MTQGSGMELAGFHDVDRAADPTALVRFLDMAKGHPVLTELQARLVAELHLRSGSRVLDAGCGPGTQTVEIARAVPGTSVVGVDASRLMVAEALRRASGSGLDVTFQLADAAALPFEDGDFSACQAQTLLEHVADPARVIEELRRVTRSGGRIAALDLDQGSTVLDHPDRENTRVIVDAWTDEFASGWAGRSLHRLFLAAGLDEVTVQVRAADFGAPFFRALLAPTTARLRREGKLAGEALDRWWAALEERGAGGAFFGASLWFLVSGTVPR
jgi:ubiquinone/menaquinone biosynthesis C-methylase UbiE